ncbi:MAG: DUF4087 domain-containing protein [Pyrinomonadaceae bacterium]
MQRTSYMRAALAGAVLLLSLCVAVFDAAAQQKLEQRCGWFENPTPSNAWLIDRDGEWLISAQGGYQADGDWPNFPDRYWKKTNINYGHGCACMRVTASRADKRIIFIKSATARPLTACRKDKALRGKEPG